MAGRINKSDVWQNFEKTTSTMARCKLCSQQISRSGGTTTGLHAHLRSKHPGLASPSNVQPRVTSFVGTSRNCSDSRQEIITAAVAKMIAENMLPISFVESKSFRDLMALVEPQYRPPCRQTMTSRMTAIKKKLQEKMSSHIEANVTKIAVTTDIWTSVTNEAYLSFTASYMDLDWTMKTPILATILMNECHTQAVISESLGSVADQWSIKNKVVALVHDGASNVKEVGNLNGWYDVHCAAHKLQLCINYAVGTHAVTNHPISKCVSAASRLVGHFSHSPMAVGELMKRQVSMDKDKIPLKLIQYCKTRWNSIYDMFERLSQLR